VIVGGPYPRIDYGFGSDVGLNYYKYGVGHGTQRPTQHTGYDVSVPCGTKLYTPISGIVDCVGNRGTPRWGQGCGAYADVDGGGVGNITIMGDSGHKLTLGHCRLAHVQPGQRVEAGQLVGTVGSMNGCHVHVEVSVNRNGTYFLLDPGPALIEAMGGEDVPIPVTYPEPNSVPQPAEFDVSVEVTVTKDGVPVLQRADLNAAHTMPPLKKGDTFGAVYQALGNDGNIYWITTNRNRVPVDGTSAPGWKGGGPIVTAPPVDLSEVRDLIDGARTDIDTRLRSLMASLED
jgi:murein DD-endopeptidase MepM/ murein hydrolase activator NlpD